MPSTYEIFTALHLRNYVSPELIKIIAKLGELEGKIGSINKGLGNMGPAIAAGLGVAVGTTAIVALGKLAEKGIELLDQKEQLVRRGMELTEVNRLTAKSFDDIGKAIPTATTSEYLKVIGELRGASGSDAMAEKLAPTGLKLQALLKNSAGGDQSQAFWQMYRAVEMKGIATDEGKATAFLESAAPWFMAQGSKLTPAMFQSFARGSGAAWMNTDISAAMPGIMTSIGDISGPMAGKAIMSLYQFMMGATQIPNQSAAMLSKLGLMDPSKVQPGGFGKVIPGELLGAGEHYGDIPGWVRDVVMPAVAKEAGGDPMMEQKILLKMLGNNRNALKMMEMFGLPGFQEQIQKEKKIAGKVMPIDPAYQQYITKNPKGVIEGFSAQWNSMLSAIGAPLMQAAMPVMKSLTSMFTSIGSVANANPQFIGDLGKTIFMLSTTGAGAGVGALVGMLFGPPGAAVGGLVGAMLGALTGFAAVKWDSITTGFDTIKKAIEGFWKWLSEIGKTISDWVGKIRGLLHLTSFGGGGGDGSFGGSSGAHLQYASLIQQYGGDNAANMMKIYRTEGPQGYAVGDGGTSFGPFQAHLGGPGSIGTEMVKSGIDIRSPSSMRQQIEWMNRYGHRTGGYSPQVWHGLRDKGVGYLPSGGGYVPPYKGQQDVRNTPIHVNTYLDGKMVANNVVNHVLKSSEHSRGAAYFDAYHSYAGPDRQTSTA